MKLELGNVIKSYDFVGSEDIYFVGEVIDLDGEVITCKTIERVVQGEPVEADEKFQTLTQGSMLMDDIFERIVIL